MKIGYTVLGPFMTNSYVVYNEKTNKGILIDPSFDPETLYKQLVLPHHLDIETILLTHAHVDHIAGLNWFRKKFPGARVYMDKRDEPFLRDPQKNLSAMFPDPVTCDDPDCWVKDGDVIHSCGYTFNVIDTSGHTPGGVSYYMPEYGIVFTGDSLFQGSIGRTDFPGGNTQELVNNIRTHLLTLPYKTIVCPGHGEMTTIGLEKINNPFLQGDIHL